MIRPAGAEKSAPAFSRLSFSPSKIVQTTPACLVDFAELSKIREIGFDFSAVFY